MCREGGLPSSPSTSGVCEVEHAKRALGGWNV